MDSNDTEDKGSLVSADNTMKSCGEQSVHVDLVEDTNKTKDKTGKKRSVRFDCE